MDITALTAVAAAWMDRFARQDLDGLLALYAPDATHTSPKIRALHPDTGGVLRGHEAMRGWWADAFARLPGLLYDSPRFTADGSLAQGRVRGRVFVEYLRRLPGEADLPVAEVYEVEDGLIVASRVYHG